MTYYRAKHNKIMDGTRNHIATVVPEPGLCSMRAAREMAAYCAQQMNHNARRKELRNASQPKGDTK